MFTLKPLSSSAIPAALSKAERYRLLNEPEQSQSICEDVLRADPNNTEAIVTLILALSDAFPRHQPGTAARAVELVARLPGEYERCYYGGLVAERRARAPAPPARGCRKRWPPTSGPKRCGRPTMTKPRCAGTPARVC